MRVMIQLREDAAMELHKQLGQAASASEWKSETRQLLAAAAKLGSRLEPVHPGKTEVLLVPHFMAEVADRETAEKLISRFQQFKIVEAAYLKPDEQLP